MSTPSEVLGRAADLIRDTAAAAVPAPWEANVCDVWFAGPYEAEMVADCGDSRTARWVALMSPAVAEPLAEALDVAAGTAREMEEDGREVNPSWAMLDLARALVGSVSEENTHD